MMYIWPPTTTEAASWGKATTTNASFSEPLKYCQLTPVSTHSLQILKSEYQISISESGVPGDAGAPRGGCAVCRSRTALKAPKRRLSSLEPSSESGAVEPPCCEPISTFSEDPAVAPCLSLARSSASSGLAASAAPYQALK